MTAPAWTGPECFMCNGTGRDRTAVTEPHGTFARVVGHVENGLPCRACNGHGRQPGCEPDAHPWHPVDGTHQRQCADCGVWADVDENPAAATESATVSGVASCRMGALAHTRETPAKARTDRGRGPTFKESNVNDRTPQRIQRKRSKGWKMPEGAVYVGRPTLLGNPFRVIRSTCCPTVDVVDDNGMTYVIDHAWSHANGWSDVNRPGAWKWARGEAVRLFSADLTYWWGGRIVNDERLGEAVAALRGKDLACWCPLDQACHADVLLEIANGDEWD